MTRFYYDAQGREHESGDWDADAPRPMSADDELRRTSVDSVCTCGPWQIGQPWGHFQNCRRAQVLGASRMIDEDDLRRMAELALDAEPLGPLPTDPSMSIDPRVILDMLARAALAARSEALEAARSEPRLHPDDGYAYDGCEGPACRAARSEPRVEGLTRVERPKSMWHGGHQCRECGLHWDAATPPAEGLDVERLREALRQIQIWPADGDYAEVIAREYAALAPEQPE